MQPAMQVTCLDAGAIYALPLEGRLGWGSAHLCVRGVDGSRALRHLLIYVHNAP